MVNRPSDLGQHCKTVHAIPAANLDPSDGLEGKDQVLEKIFLYDTIAFVA